jgi:murein DD-endopeptidase MepM/ murein hydrolase activator NlpD
MLKKQSTSFAAALLAGLGVLMGSSAARAQTKSMHEANEPVGGYPTLSELRIDVRSPFRINGADELVHVNAQYNQVRGSGRTHLGVDLRGARGKEQYAMYGNGTVRMASSNPCEPAGFGGYGRFVAIQHTHTANGKTYAFQSFHAHLTTINTSQGASVGSNSIIGKTGGSGNCLDTTYAPHAHIEFRVPTASGVGETRYAPGVFFQHQGEWGLSTSFINHIPGRTPNEIGFRVAAQVSGCNIPVPVKPSSVRLYYRKKGTSTWQGPAGMTVQFDGITYYRDMTDLLGSDDYIAEYYVSADDPTWPISKCKPTKTAYRAWRPYRYVGTGTPPSDRPLSKQIGVSFDRAWEQAAADASWLDSGNPGVKAAPGAVLNTAIDEEEINLLGRVTGQENGYWVLQDCGDDFACAGSQEPQVLIAVEHAGAADLQEGMRAVVHGAWGGQSNGRDIVVVSSEFGIEPKDLLGEN